jgi:NADPH2:quinone reductase
MKVIDIAQNGDASVLILKDKAIPTPGAGQVLVKLKAIGVNFIDIYQRKGTYPIPLPYTPGLEGSGIVEAVGSDVTEVKPGDRVAYTGSIGSYAEYNLVKAYQLIPLPEDISFEQGAAFPLQGMTAHYLLHEFYHIKPNDDVLVHAAAGGMGLLLVQWLKHLGATVIGTVSTREKAEVAKKAGADHIILYTEQDFVAETKQLTQNKGADYIIDGVGKTTFTKNLEAAKRRGYICIFGSASGSADPIAPNQLQVKSLRIWGGSLFNYQDTREEILMRANAVLKGMQEGWLKIKADFVYPLAEAAKAQQQLETRNTTGKVILHV